MGYSFDGANRLIVLTAGTTELDVRDCYSRWKDWTESSDNSKYLEAFSVVGGEPIDVVAGIYVTGYFFLANGWKVRPQESNHKLQVKNGILLTSDGNDPFVSTVGNYNVLVQYSQPIKTETVSLAGGTAPTAAEIADAVWDEPSADHASVGSMGVLQAVSGSLTPEQVTMLTEIYHLLGLEVAHVVEHGQDFIRCPSDGSMINIAVVRSGEKTSLQRT